MKIISQDGTKTIDFGPGIIEREGSRIVYSLNAEEFEPLGYYSDATKAQEVKNCIDLLLETETVYKMPNDEKKNDPIDDLDDDGVIKAAKNLPE